MGLMFMHARDNVLDVNPPAGARSLTLNGSNWLWAVTAVFSLLFVCQPLIFHTITALKLMY